MNLILFDFLSIFLISILGQNPGEINLHIHKAKSNKGVVRVLIFDSERGYPDKPELAIKSISAPVFEQKSYIKITDLKPGKYSIAVFHDEDENGKINTNPFGYPIEKYGFSNNAKGYFGPPDFTKTTFELKNERKAILINLR
jgi:uncharacterized protein (DUF2141 family)